MSLHQAPHLVERGIDATTAALIVGSFSLMSGVGTFACGMLPRRCRFPARAGWALLALGALLMTRIGSAAEGYVARRCSGWASGEC